MRSRVLLPILVAALVTVACGPAEIVPEPYRPTDDWDAYRHGLELAGLADTALGRDWIRAGREALTEPVETELPYVERGAFRAEEHVAVGYRFEVPRGQRVEVVVERDDASGGRLFLDLFRLEPGEEPERVASAPEDDARLGFEPRRAGVYLLRAQPELLRGGPFALEIRAVEAFTFPVADHGVGDIQSVFGAAREAGRRRHHGVDIFAPRGTPVVAATAGVISRVEVRDLGGKVVWLRDTERNAHLYYAHLETQEVEEGVRVEPGDIVGTVGNSGNARTTPPHLHFGIYFRGEGPYDPEPYLRPPTGRPARLTVDPGRAGALVASREGAPLRAAATRRADTIRELTPGQLLRVEAATGSYYRVRIPGGRSGFMAASDLREVGAPALGGAE